MGRTTPNWAGGLALLAGLGYAAPGAGAQEQPAVQHDDRAPPTAQDAESYGTLKERLLARLPRSVSDGLDFGVWGWAGALTQGEGRNYWDAELAVGITKVFDQRVALSGQVNFIDANGNARVVLQQGYASARVVDSWETIVTIGKFNADFGVEGRDFWERRTGTTSLLFGAQPQDLVGAMVTQPIGDTGLKLRPFISADFQGQFEFDQPPSGGLKTEYRPDSRWKFIATGWVGPGVVAHGGEPLSSPYSRGDYGSDPAAIVLNWQGPNFDGQRAETLYFVEGAAVWRPREDLTLSAEYLIGTTPAFRKEAMWQGFLLMAAFDITDRLHTYARWSYLDDPQWLITGVTQLRQEVSVGFGFEIYHGVEVRAEYRHDVSDATESVHSLSGYVSFSF